MYFIDVQGTLIDDINKEPIRGSIEFINSLNSSKTPYMVITNNTKKESGVFLKYLNSIGLNIPDSHYLDPLMLLESRVSKASVAAYGSSEFLEVLEKMGYRLNYENPQAVLIATKEDFKAYEYAEMIDFLLNGASLVGMHETSIYAKNSKRYPGVGAVLKMLEFATSAKYEVVGKPSVNYYNKSLSEIKKQNALATFEKLTIISDDVKGDLSGAKMMGMKTIFVTSGKFKNADEILPLLKEHEQPDAVYEDMQNFMESL